MRRLLVLASLLVAMLNAASVSAASITIDSATVTPGGEVTVGIRAVDITELFTYSFDLTFDAAILAATGISDGGFLSTALIDSPEAGVTFIPGTISPGLISLTLASIFGPLEQGGATGSGALAFVTFQAIGVGTANLALANVLLLDSTFPAGQDIADVTLMNGTVTSVPEPSTLALLGVGLAAMARKKLKRKAVG